MTSLLERANELSAEFIAYRRDFHQHPELGFEEIRTAKIVTYFLQQLGIEVESIAGTGVVGLLKGKPGGKTIALRADMDALTIPEQTGTEYASTHPGIMHACGHDGHTAILMGTAKLLAEHKNFTGNIKFIFQPAEEGPGGALPMLEAGVLDNPRVDTAVGLHLGTIKYTTGQIALRDQAVCAAPDTIQITIKGKGGHGAHPHNSVDAIVTAGHIITSLQSIISREMDPLASAVITIGTINGGYRQNIIADEVVMRGTVRTLDSTVRDSMPERIERILKGICDSFRCEYEFAYEKGYPVLVNDTATTEHVRQVASRLLGEGNVFWAPHPSMGGEDFSYFAEKVPSCFFSLGAMNVDKQCNYPGHHPKFNFDENAIPVGMALLAEICLDYLNCQG